jgi:phage terminase large subunit GpA-like protein
MTDTAKTAAVVVLLSAALLLGQVRKLWAPPPALTTSEWAAQKRVLSSAASPSPGPWRTDRDPWQAPMMDWFHEDAETIAVMKSGQIGVTEAAILNRVGYNIEHHPGPMLLVEPSENLAKRLSRNRLEYMFRATPSLAERVPERRGRRGALLHKDGAGWNLDIAGANSATPLSSDPKREVYLDEVDKYPPHLGDEGDPVSLALKRTTTFWNRKHLLVSTPTLKGSSTIEKWFLLGDQRRWVMPCPRCGRHDWFTWNDAQHFHVVFTERDASTAHFRCPSPDRSGCGGRIEDHERAGMIARGAWIAQAPFRGVISAHIWEAYASTARLSRIVANFLRARDLGREELREWTNQTLGETWEEPGEAIETHALLARVETYLAEVPAGVLFLTAGVDTQDDRLEVWIWGWGLGEEAWLIDIRTLPGDPKEPEVWAMLDELLERQWQHARGHRPMIAAVAIDSGGHRTDHVYAYVTKNQHRRVYATIGRDGQRPIYTPGHQPREGQRRRQCPLFVVGVDNAKAELHARLRLPGAGPGFLHLPKGHPQVDESTIGQLTAERLVTRYDRRKRQHHVWELARPGVRNEGLDCTVLALWALRALRPDMRAAAAQLAAAPVMPVLSEPTPAPAIAPAVPALEPVAVAAEPVGAPAAIAAGVPSSSPVPTPPARPAPAPSPYARRFTRSRYLS